MKIRTEIGNPEAEVRCQGGVSGEILRGWGGDGEGDSE